VARHEKRFDGSIGWAVQPSMGSSRRDWYSFWMRLVVCGCAGILECDFTRLVCVKLGQTLCVVWEMVRMKCSGWRGMVWLI